MKKMLSYQYMDSHVKDETVSPTVLSLTWESPYLGKTVFILNQGPGTHRHLCGSIELHGAGAQRDHGVTQGQVLSLKDLHVADDVGLWLVPEHNTERTLA